MLFLRKEATEMAQRRLAEFTTSVEEILSKLSVQERNALFHDLNEVKAKYVKKLNMKKSSSYVLQASKTKRQTKFTRL